MVSVEEALRLVVENVQPLGHETISLCDATKQVLAADVFADRNSPPWRKSMMDGFAVRSSDINSGLQTLKVIETVTAGESPTVPVEAGQATRIMTGAPVPEGADAIVMIEQCVFDEGSAEVKIELDSISAGKHLMETGCNFGEGDLIFPAGRKIRALDIGLLAEVGAASLSVFKKPTAAVLPTGDELVSADTVPAGPQIRNSNGPCWRCLPTEALPQSTLASATTTATTCWRNCSRGSGKIPSCSPAAFQQERSISFRHC